MQLYLAVTPNHVERCLSLTPHLAHMAFRIGSDGSLLCRSLPGDLRGGLMMVDCEADFLPNRAELLARDILRRCLHWHFSGIVLDAPGQRRSGTAALAAALDRLCLQYQRRLYVPEIYAADAPQSQVLVCTALSGGSLREYLEETCGKHDPKRIALDLQRLMMAFPLPCPSGEGTPLTPAALTQCAKGRSIYYCEGLCARYFTHRQSNQTRFVLFDDGDTLRRKIALAESMGISEGFFMWPEVADIAVGLFEKKKEGEP